MHELDIASRIQSLEATLPAAASLLRGRFEPLEIAGRHAQGDVVRAWDHQHGRPVALKVTRVGLDDDRDGILAQARMLLGLTPHPSIAIVRDDFFEGDAHYLVLDWVSGEDLRSRLRRDGNPGLPFEMVVAAVRDVAAALDHLHAHTPPFIHGDIKPANVVVTDDGAVPKAVLVGFGPAPTPAEVPGGTLAYAAPEVASGTRPSIASDVYSLAATTFELLTGRIATPTATLDWSGIPGPQIADVRGALVTGFSVDPGQRPATATAFVDQLSTTPTRARRRALRGRGPGAGRPSRTMSGVAVILAAAAGAAGAVALDDDAPVASSAIDETVTTLVAAALPAGEERIGRLGIYTDRGVYETYAVGEDGAAVLEERQERLANGWTTIAPLSDSLLLFYRERDAAAGVIDWADDGAVLDLYAPALAAGWTHLRTVRPGQIYLYSATTGARSLSAYDGEGNLLSDVDLPPTRAGWTHVTRVTDGSLMHYDDVTGEAALVSLDAAGTAHPPVTVTGIPAGLVTIDAIGDGLLALGDGERGSVSVVSVAAGGIDEAAALDVGMAWNRSAPLAEGRLLLYDQISGRAVILAVDDGEVRAGPELALLPNGSVLIGRA